MALGAWNMFFIFVYLSATTLTEKTVCMTLESLVLPGIDEPSRMFTFGAKDMITLTVGFTLTAVQKF